MFEPNRDYEVRVASAYLVASTAKGTPGIELCLEHDTCGSIMHTLWLTPKTAEGVRKALAALGVEESLFSRPTFLDNCNDYLAGKACSIRTFEEEYNGKKRTKVQWINSVGTAPAGDAKDLARRAAQLLSGKPAPATEKAAPVAVDEDDVPF